MRTGRRVAEKYKQQEQEAAALNGERRVAEATCESEIFAKVCRPKWQQESSTRLQSIVDSVKKKKVQEEVAYTCYDHEVFMHEWCKPDMWHGVANREHCVGNLED